MLRIRLTTPDQYPKYLRLKNIFLEFLMRFFIKSLLSLVGPMFVIIGLSAPTAAQDKTALQQDRNLTMKVLARSMSQLKKANNVADMEGPASAILSATKQLFNMWPEGSGGAKTRAKNEIWSNISDFNAKLTDMKKAANNLLLAVKGTDRTIVQSRFISVGKTCGGCHKIYRGPKL